MCQAFTVIFKIQQSLLVESQLQTWGKCVQSKDFKKVTGQLVLGKQNKVLFAWWYIQGKFVKPISSTTAPHRCQSGVGLILLEQHCALQIYFILKEHYDHFFTLNWRKLQEHREKVDILASIVLYAFAALLL